MGYISSALNNFISFTREFGVRGAVQVVMNNRNASSLKKIVVKKYPYPFYYRQGTTDFPILRFIIGQELVFKNIQKPALIIDAGANVGYVSVFYAHCFPKGQVIAIEMEDSNFEILKKNTQEYKNIKILKAALWNHNKGVSFGESSGKDSFNLMDQSAPQYTVQSVTLKELLKDGAIADIIKLDIEGAEVEVLEDMKINAIQPRVLVIELHDRFRDGCSQALERYLEGRKFSRKKIYEYDVIDFRK